MNQNPQDIQQEPPAIGERRARWGYGYQDKVATERILSILREDLRESRVDFEGVRLADLEAGRVDDFVLVWRARVEGNAIKWSESARPINWSDLIGTNGMLKDLAEGYSRLADRWTGRSVSVKLQSNRPPSPEKHHAQLVPWLSVSDFLAVHWPVGPTDHDSDEVAEVWRRVAEHVGLTGSALSRFISSCSLTLGHLEPPGSGPDTADWRQYKKQFDDLHKAVATWLTNKPDIDFIDRDFLLSAIGFRPYRSGLIQRFPQPAIPYEQNQASADQLRHLIEETAGGYLAVVGPAGVGKSTLVQDLLTELKSPFFVPYYCFLPHTDGNRDRGEALTFFQDVIGRLDRLSAGRLSLGIADVAQGRDALRRHFAKANERYLAHGHKTILLVDGLDHVAREVSLQWSVLNELPSPDEIPDGFLIILSSQPQVLIPSVISPMVVRAVEQSGRGVDVSGLSRIEVHKIVANVAKATTSAERDNLHSACLGNPLILTYILTEFLRNAGVNVDEAIRLAGRYDGDLERYYQNALAIPLEDGNTRWLLGLLCRAAPTIPMAWLLHWPERVQVEDVYRRVIAPFVRIEDGTLHFIHDSLIAFLKAATRSKLPSAEPTTEERRFHSTLADRCSGYPCRDPVGRAHILHLLRADRKSELLGVLSSEWLREPMKAFVPYALVHPILLAGLEAAWNTGEFGHVLRLILLDHELDQRTSRTDPGHLAEVFLELDKPDLAVSQVRAAGRLLFDDKEVLQFARILWFYGDQRSRPSLKETARVLYLQAKPISLLYMDDPVDMSMGRAHSSLLHAWSAVAPLFEEGSTILEGIRRLRFTGSQRGEVVDVAALKGALLYTAWRTVLETGADVLPWRILLEELAKLGGVWRFAAHLRLAESKLTQVPISILQQAFTSAMGNSDMALAYGQFLFNNGHLDEARKIVNGLAHIRFDVLEPHHSFGFSDVSYTVELRRLQELLDIPEGAVPGVKDDGEEAIARVETAARRLGVLLAHSRSRRKIVDLHSSIRSLLLFQNQSVSLPDFDWRKNYFVESAKGEIYEQVVRLASGLGRDGLEALRDTFQDLISGPASEQFSPSHRRLLSRALYERGVLSKKATGEFGLSSTLDASDVDPTTRQEACFEIGIFLHSVGEDEESSNWLIRASDVSAGAGSHKDYQMSHVADWLSRSIPNADGKALVVLDKFVRAVEVAGGAGSSRAAAQELQLILRLDPLRAVHFAVELIDRQVLNLSTTLEALIIGGAIAGVSADLLWSIYCELHSLIDPGDSSEAAVATLRQFAPERWQEITSSIMSYVRTNALPTRRVEVARTLGDTLLEQGTSAPTLVRGLEDGREDSSRRNSLYRLATGEVETVEQVAVRLSDDTNPQNWNPNPSGNGDFDWWSAIKKARIRSVSHADALLATFPPPDYREAESLAWRSGNALKARDHGEALLLAEAAIRHAEGGSWHYWYDGAKKRVAYGALKRIDEDRALKLAHEEFGRDLAAGRLNSSQLIADIVETLDFLDITWPVEAARDALEDYLDQILAANNPTPSYASMIRPPEKGSPEEALCMFLCHLLAFAVIEVGAAARRALARFVASGRRGITDFLMDQPCWDPVQLEHILVSLHLGSRKSPLAIANLRDWMLNLNRSESVAVRGIARRICSEQGWPWVEIRDQTFPPVIVLADSGGKAADYNEALMLVGGDAAIAFQLYRSMLAMLERLGLDAEELRSEFHRVFLDIQESYRWKDDDRLQRWIRMALARHWLNPRVLLGREATMRVLGRRSLSGRAPPGAEQAYDAFAPIYDPELELYQPIERPIELPAMKWGLWDERGKAWHRGEGGGEWSYYPTSVDGLYIIGERTWLIRPDWEWPREERYRGLVADTRGLSSTSSWDILKSRHELTCAAYLRGDGQEAYQLIILNSERNLTGAVYKWAAFNSSFAKRQGWRLSGKAPFEWVNTSGTLMVKSVFWKDGWVWVEPPHFEALGEGWLVLATPECIQSIREVVPETKLHLWAERHSHGDPPYEGSWHLSQTL